MGNTKSDGYNEFLFYLRLIWGGVDVDEASRVCGWTWRRGDGMGGWIYMEMDGMNGM